MDDTKSLKQVDTTRCEKIIAVYLYLTYIINVFNNSVRAVVGNTYKLDTLLVYGLFALLCLMSIRQIVRRIQVWQIISALALVMIVLFSLCYSRDQSVNLSVVEDVAATCIPAFLLAGTVRDFNALKEYITNAAIVVPYGIAFVIFALGMNRLTTSSTYEQSMSYYMLLPTIILSGSIIERFSIKALVPLVLSVIIMVSFGARGPFVCVLMFASIKLLTVSARGSKWKKAVSVVALCSAAILIYVYFYDILQWLLDLFKELGFSVRIIQKMLNKSFLEDSSRMKIYGICLERIFSNPFIGTGMVNDRLLISTALHTSDALGNYPHNIFLEILLQFGLLPGSFLLILFGTLLVCCFRKMVSQSARSVVLIFMGSGLFPLFFSGSYVDSKDFYILMAICGAIAYTGRESAKVAAKEPPLND